MDNRDNQTSGVFRGLVFALPISLALWGLIWWAAT